MALLAYNMTAAPLALSGITPAVTLPASGSAGSRSAPVNVTSELWPNATVDTIRGITGGLAAADFTALQVQVAASAIEYEWTNGPQYLMATLQAGGPVVAIGGEAIALPAPARLATAAALGACTAAGSGVGKTLTQNVAAAETIDGVAPVLGNRVLVKNQVAGEDNGIYKVSVVGTGAVQQVLTRAADADGSAEVVSGMLVRVEEGTANLNAMFMLTTDNPIVLETTSLTFSEVATGTHAPDHLLGGADPIDGDHIDITLTPANSTPTTTPAEATSLDHLAAHLGGIDNEFADVVQDEGCSASVQAIQAGQPITLDVLVIGADTYEIDGVGANINPALGGSAELTLDNLLAEAIANGTENLFWSKLSATVLLIRAADAPQGNIIGSDPSIVLDSSGMTNWSFDVGDVDMSTLGGRGAQKRQSARITLTITAAMIAAGSVYLSVPFTPTTFVTSSRTALGAVKIAAVDTFAIVGDNILVTLPGAGTDLAATDILDVFVCR